MVRRRFSSFAVLSCALGILILLLTLVVARRRIFTPPDEAGETEARTIRPSKPRPVPPELDALYREVGELEQAGNYERAADRYLLLVSRLAALWGEDSVDLIPYYYNFAYLLRAAGGGDQAQAFLAEGLKRWPGDLRLEVLHLSLRAEEALARRSVPPELYRQIERVVVEKNYPYLRGLGVPPEALFTQWGALLLEEGSLRPALAKADAALALESGYAPAKRLRGRILLSLGRNEQAAEIFSALLEVDQSTELEYYLGIALFDGGEYAEAYSRLSKLLEKIRSSAEAKTKLGPLAVHLRGYVARALVALDRPEESSRLVLESLVSDPYDVEMLRILAEATRGSGHVEAARALERRAESLEVREALARRLRAVRAARRESASRMLEGLMALSVDKVGGALDSFRLASGESPDSAEPHLAYGHALELLGRNTRADETYDEGIERTRSTVLLLEKARLAASEGRPEDARKILDDGRLAIRSKSIDDETFGQWIGRRLRAYLEIGDLESVRAFLRANPVEGGESRAILLSSVELALVDRRLSGLETVLDREGNFRFEERSWERALDYLLGFERVASSGTKASGKVPFDPSDLIDHARFLRKETYARLRAMQDESFNSLAERLRTVVRRRRELLDRSQTGDDQAWRELFDIYRSVGARRKAREVAWFLFDREPESVASFLRVLEALDRPEDVVDRLAVIARGLERAAENAELQEARKAARRQLGLGD